MVLIVLYIFSLSLVILSDFAPLEITGIFMSICYIPGLCLFSLGKKVKLTFEDLLLVFPCSVGISSVLILGLLSLGIHIGYVFPIINTVSGILVLLYIFTRNNKNPYMTINLSKHDILFFTSAALFTLFLGIPLLFGSDRIAISYHGFFHSTLITQILNGIFPPGNPGLGGTNVSIPWGFHAFIATLSTPTNLHPFRIISLLNLISLFTVFCLAYRSAIAFGLSKSYSYLASLAVIGLARADAGVFFIVKLVTGHAPSLNNLPPAPWQVAESLTWAPNLPYIWDPRLYFLHKFYNTNAMPLGISLSISAVFILLILYKNGFLYKGHRKLYLIIMGILFFASIFIYTPFAVVPLFFTPLWAGFIFFSNHGGFKDKIKGASVILLPYFIGVLIALPYLLFISTSSPIGARCPDCAPADGQLLSLDFYYQSLINLMAFWLLFPVIITGIWIVIKRLAHSKELFFLLMGTLLCLGLLVFMRLPLDNSYKFAYIFSFFFALLFVFVLSDLLPLLRFQWLKGFVIAGVILFLLSTPVLIGTSYILSSWFRNTTYTLSDGHISFANDSMKNGPYKWIRDNTPPEALIMLTYVKTSPEECAPPDEDSGMESIYKTAALTERTLFVLEDQRLTTRSPEYERRVEIREKLFKNPGDPRVSEFFSALNRPIYLLVEETSKPLSENTKFDFSLMFQNDKGGVYLIYDKS